MEHFCQLLNPVTVQHLKTSEKQFGEEIHLIKAEHSKQMFESWQDPDEDDMRPEMLKTLSNFAQMRGAFSQPGP